jgi:uncharacterized membrane protein YbhN (UPF0104 family)
VIGAAERRRLLAWAVRVGIVGAIGVGGARLLRTLDWVALGRTARDANWALLVAVAVLCAALAPLRAERMRLLLLPFARVSTWRLTDWYLASWAADNLVMSQAGMGVRVALVRAAGVPLMTAAAQQALEKVLDAASLAVLLPLLPLGALSGLTLQAWGAIEARRLVLVLAGATVAAAGGALLLLLRRRPRALQRIAASAVALSRPRIALAVLALSVGQWAVEVAMVGLTLSALSLPATAARSAEVVLAVTLAALLPGLPGNLGTYEAAAMAALVSSGASPSSALGAALVYHALHTLPVTALGVGTLRRLGWLRRAPAGSSASPPSA